MSGILGRSLELLTTTLALRMVFDWSSQASQAWTPTRSPRNIETGFDFCKASESGMQH